MIETGTKERMEEEEAAERGRIIREEERRNKVHGFFFPMTVMNAFKTGDA